MLHRTLTLINDAVDGYVRGYLRHTTLATFLRDTRWAEFDVHWTHGHVDVELVEFSWHARDAFDVSDCDLVPWPDPICTRGPAPPGWHFGRNDVR